MTTHVFKHRVTALTALLAFVMLNNIGAGLTQVVVYRSLASINNSPDTFALIFALFGVGTFIGVSLNRALMTTLGAQSTMAVAAVTGFVSTLFAMTGEKIGSSSALYAAELLAAAATAVMYPSLQSIIKALSDGSNSWTEKAARLALLAYSGQVLFGTLLGTLLAPHVNPHVYFGIDILTSVLAMAFLCCTRLTDHKDQNSGQTDQARTNAQSLLSSPERRRGILYLPALALLSSGIISSFPSLASGIKVDGASLEAANLAAWALAFRGFGQLATSLLPSSKMIGLAAKYPRLFGCVFLAHYLLACKSENLVLAGSLVVLAHYLSNHMFIAGYSALQRSFSAQEMDAASRIELQLFTLALLIGSIGFSNLIKVTNLETVLCVALATYSANVFCWEPIRLRRTLFEKRVGEA